VRSAPLRLQAYVLGRTLVGVAIALAVVSSVIALIDFVELSRTLGGRQEMSFLELLALIGLKSPAVILQLAPFIFLFGVMGAFVALNRRSELIAVRAAGVSAWRFVLPTAAAAFLIGVAAVAALNPLAAAMNARFETRRAAIILGGQAERDIWLRQGDDRGQIVIHGKSHDTVGDVVRLKGVSLFIQSLNPGGGRTISRRIEAVQARLEPGFWRLSGVREASPGSVTEHSDQLLIPSMLDHRTAMESFAAPGAVAFWRLPATIRAAELAGYSSVGYRLRFQQLLATPLLFSAMSILAAAFSLRLMRLGGLAGMAAAGVGLGFLVFFLNQFCGALGSSEVMPAPLAAWAPPILALLAGVTLLCYTEDG
jgi:lipopolysaccharide export system permease protein